MYVCVYRSILSTSEAIWLMCTVKLIIGPGKVYSYFRWLNKKIRINPFSTHFLYCTVPLYKVVSFFCFSVMIYATIEFSILEKHFIATWMVLTNLFLNFSLRMDLGFLYCPPSPRSVAVSNKLSKAF